MLYCVSNMAADRSEQFAQRFGLRSLSKALGVPPAAQPFPTYDVGDLAARVVLRFLANRAGLPALDAEAAVVALATEGYVRPIGDAAAPEAFSLTMAGKRLVEESLSGERSTASTASEPQEHATAER